MMNDQQIDRICSNLEIEYMFMLSVCYLYHKSCDHSLDGYTPA